MNKLKLIHSNPDFLVFYKPEGLSFYEDGQKHDLLKEVHQMEADSKIPEGERIFPVHRLDRITSGLILFARSRTNANLLGNEFRHNRVNKIYAAISVYPPKKRHGFIEGDIVKSRRGIYKLSQSTDLPSRTQFTSRSIPNRRPGLRLFLVRPETGKTHQVRVVLKSIGSAILGDPQYDRFDSARSEDRTYLHAIAISFQLKGQLYKFVHLPETGIEYLTAEFKQTLDSFGDLFQINWPAKSNFQSKDHGFKSQEHSFNDQRLGFRNHKQSSNSRKSDSQKRSKRPGRRERHSKSS